MSQNRVGPGVDPYRLLVEHATDYAAFTTDVESRVQTWSAGATRILGWTEEEMLGVSIDIIFVPEDRDAGVPQLERSLAVRAGRAENERWHVKRDGSRFWGAGIMVPLRAADGTHLGYGKLLRDFTRRRELETAQIEAQRMESVGVLAAGLAHLFNNLLTSTLGNLDLLIRLPELRHHATAQELARDAMRSGHRMAELTQQILTYTGKARSMRTAVELCDEVRQAIEGLTEELPAGVRVDLNLSPACPPVEADPALLRQLVAVLVRNAAEAQADRGGAVTVEVDAFELSSTAARQGDYRAFALHPGLHARLRVRDTGPGLPQEALGRVFEPFYSTKFLGRGLGLPTAMGITRLHRGAIAARSEPGAGATFEVLIPASGAAVAASRDGERLALVVDDEELIRSLTMRMLEAEGFTVIGAENGEQAIGIAGQLRDRIGVVVLDLVMPVMDGTAALPKLRELLPQTPVVVMTGKPTVEIEEDATQLGVAAWIPKPFTFDQLLGAVNDALARSAPETG